ncbi:NACHT domain-containing protein [Trichocoleus sp. DQ-A3]|uniref:beta-propeller domain-containing protein n=1 Tax=Cyanophyceae TaxID=3028117 RepID=UPI00168275E2|nr:NACHT domain-containing protein [Coleofasciculus sp. FACHB-125]MBD1898905.1 NACHT domain-containing protein [Coleofasciculus sp. FACHB-125]
MVLLNPKQGIDFTDYIAERTRNFTGREWVFEKIHNWLSDLNSSRYFLLTGEPGSGKTALAARLTQISQGSVSLSIPLSHLKKDFLNAIHFCSANDSRRTNPKIFSESIALQLAALPEYALALQDTGEKQVNINATLNVQSAFDSVLQAVVINNLTLAGLNSQEEFDQAIVEPLHTIYNNGFMKPITILIDSLDESLLHEGKTKIANLLARLKYLPLQVRFILTTRTEEEIINLFQKSSLEIVSLTEGNGLIYSREDVKSHIVRMFDKMPRIAEKLNPELPKAFFINAISHKSDGNFLYVSNLLLMLAEESEINQASLEGLPDGIDGFYTEFLQRLINRTSWSDWEEHYAPILGTLAVAQEPLSRDLLAKFLGKRSSSQLLTPLRNIRQFLDSDESLPPSQRIYSIYHRSFTDFLLNEDRAESYWCEEIEQHERITHHYLSDQQPWHTRLSSDLYLWKYLAYHLSRAERNTQLGQLLLDLDWLQSKLNSTDTTSVLSDYGYLPNDTNLQLVRNAIQLSAHILVENKAQLSEQLLGRLLSYAAPEITELLTQARQRKGCYWLRPLISSLVSPGEPLLRTLTGHSREVNGVAVLPNKSLVISASTDRTLKVWNLMDGSELCSLGTHDGEVTSVAVTLDGQHAVSGSADRTLKIWDLAGGTLQRTLEGHGAVVTSVAVTPDGQHAISGSADCTLKIWDLAGGTLQRTLEGHNAVVTSVAVTPDGQHAVSGSADCTLKIWDLASGTLQRTLEGHGAVVTSVAVTPDGQHAVSASNDHTLKIWNLTSNSAPLTLEGHADRVWAVAVTPDGQRAISGSTDETLKIWNLTIGAEECTLQGHTREIYAVTVVPDQQQVISASWDRTLKVWNLRKPLNRVFLHNHTDGITKVRASKNGQLAVTVSLDKTIKIWDLSTRSVKQTLRGHPSPLWATAIAPSGHFVVSASVDGTIRLWDLANESTVLDFRGHTDAINSVAILPDEQYAISASWDRTLKIWNLASGTNELTLQGHTSAINAVAVSANGQRAISASADGTLRVWNLMNAEVIYTLTHSGEVTSVSTTPDGQTAISSSNDSSIKVWDLNTGICRFTLQEHKDGVNGVSLTSDAPYFVSCSHDCKLTLWDLMSGNSIASFTGDSSFWDCTAFANSSGVTLLAGDAMGKLHILHLESP